MKDSKIEWTHHTFNPWWGCVKVSPGCEHCYAETFANRTGNKVWGKDAPRRFFGDKHWKEPLFWEDEARESGERRRVFCASMADVFEDREDLIPERDRLCELIEKTPHLDWLMLTKRPENMERLLPRWIPYGWPKNIWAGTTVEDQKRAEQRIPILAKLPASVRFLSVEPMLEEIDLSPFSHWSHSKDEDGKHSDVEVDFDWVICGGESGPKARPIDLLWVRRLRDLCVNLEVPFFFKQWGGVQKHKTGRVLDGRTWDELPNPH